jgi:hypothetical protein
MNGKLHSRSIEYQTKSGKRPSRVIGRRHDDHLAGFGPPRIGQARGSFVARVQDGISRQDVNTIGFDASLYQEALSVPAAMTIVLRDS